MCLWTLILRKIIEVMKKRGHGVNLISPASLTMISVVSFPFVETTNLHMSTLTHNTTGEELQPLFQGKLNC